MLVLTCTYGAVLDGSSYAVLEWVAKVRWCAGVVEGWGLEWLRRRGVREQSRVWWSWRFVFGRGWRGSGIRLLELG